MPTELIIWDLDGTLVNSLPLTIEAMRDGAEPFVGRRLSNEEILSHFGKPDDQIMGILAGTENQAEAFTLMLNAMQRKLLEVELFEGIPEALAKLREAGLRFGLFTGRGRKSTQVILNHLKLEPWFESIVTGTDLAQSKPHPAGIFRVIQEMSGELESSLMVGDSHHDLIAANAAGVRAAACVWDARADIKTLESYTPAIVAQNPAQLVDWILKHRY